jgi:hypothetical protein
MDRSVSTKTRLLRIAWPPAYAVTTLVLVSLLIATLGYMGRVPWCHEGLGIWTWRSASRCTSQHLGDPYSFTHVTHGILFYSLVTSLARSVTLRWRYFAVATLETAWEILENTPTIIARYRQQTAALGYVGDSILNSAGDLLFCGAGFALAAWLPTKLSAALAVGMELVLLITIRDNLTLNVLLLVFPLPALRQWQLGQA